MNRPLTEDQHDTIIAIKQRCFDDFWKERCGSEDYLSHGEKYGVITNLALETFDKSDWYFFQKCVTEVLNYRFTRKGMRFKKEKTISSNQILTCYIRAFTLMRMVFPDSV